MPWRAMGANAQAHKNSMHAHIKTILSCTCSLIDYITRAFGRGVTGLALSGRTPRTAPECDRDREPPTTSADESRDNAAKPKAAPTAATPRSEPPLSSTTTPFREIGLFRSSGSPSALPEFDSTSAVSRFEPEAAVPVLGATSAPESVSSATCSRHSSLHSHGVQIRGSITSKAYSCGWQICYHLIPNVT